MNLHLHHRVPPLIVTAIAGALGWTTAHTSPGLRWEFAARPWLALTFALAGIACSLLGVASFRRARTTVNPRDPGAATTLVVSGIYRFTRNPMYLGFLLLLLGELAWLAHPIALAVAPALVLYLNRFQIAPEEQALRHCFGIEYLIYTTRVSRWI